MRTMRRLPSWRCETGDARRALRDGRCEHFEAGGQVGYGDKKKMVVASLRAVARRCLRAYRLRVVLGPNTVAHEEMSRNQEKESGR